MEIDIFSLINGSCFWPSYIDDANAMDMLVAATFLTDAAEKNRTVKQ